MSSVPQTGLSDVPTSAKCLIYRAGDPASGRVPETEVPIVSHVRKPDSFSKPYTDECITSESLTAFRNHTRFSVPQSMLAQIFDLTEVWCHVSHPDLR